MGRLVNPGEYVDGPYFDKDGWKECPAPSLRGHIANTHLRPLTLMTLGLPLFDIEVAEARGFDLEWVVRKALERIKSPDNVIRAEAPLVDPRSYRFTVAKTLRLIEQHDLATIPWDEIDTALPHASEMTIEPGDITDISFKALQAQDDSAIARIL